MAKVNGDNPGSVFDRLKYFAQCIHEHSKGVSHPIQTIVPELNGDISEDELTPTRILCNAFWSLVNYQYIRKVMGDPLHFLDLGCGSGAYGEILKRNSGSYFGAYTGLDIYYDPVFPKQYSHVLARAEHAHSYLDNEMNFVIYQSALEHIEHDFLVVRSLTKTFIRERKSFIQIHLVPGASSLWLYLWHGWRQYSKRRLSQWGFKLNNEFDVNSAIVPIGGIGCFVAHFLSVTLPVYGGILLSYVLPKRSAMNSANKRPALTCLRNFAVRGSVGSSRSPVFWGFIVCSKDLDPARLFTYKMIK